VILTKTPYRISFVGGGTDLKDFYQLEGGAVLSTTIDKHIFHFVSSKEDSGIRVGHYQATEDVKSVDEIQHPIIRECLKLVGITDKIQVDAQAPIRARSGLGSSSSYCVGLLNALHAYKGELASAEQLAREACKVEIDILGEPIGKQDQYAAAYGGLNLIQFGKNDEVYVEPLLLSKSSKEKLKKNLMLFDTGLTRDASTVLTEQKKETKNKRNILSKMKYLAFQARDTLQSEDFDEFGRLLHQNWEYKTQLASNISNPVIENYYRKAMDAGALGGKILGAGGGGYFLFYVPEEKQDSVRKALKDLRETNFNFESHGSRIVYVDD